MQDRDEKIFDIIYEAAKEAALLSSEEKGRMALKTSLSAENNVNIYNFIHEPARKLATEGNKNAAELLRSLGADITAIALGALDGGDLEYAKELRSDQKINLNRLVERAAFNGHFKFAEDLLKARDVEWKYFVMGAVLGKSFEDEQTSLRSLACIESEKVRKELVDALFDQKIDRRHLLNEAKKIQNLMASHQLTYNQALALSIPAVEGLIQSINQEDPPLPKDLAALVVDFLTTLPPSDTASLVNKTTQPQAEAPPPPKKYKWYDHLARLLVHILFLRSRFAMASSSVSRLFNREEEKTQEIDRNPHP